MNLIIFSPFTPVCLWLRAAAVDNENSIGLTAPSIPGSLWKRLIHLYHEVRSRASPKLSIPVHADFLFVTTPTQLSFSVGKNWSVQIAKLIPGLPRPGCCCKKAWEGIEGLRDSPFPLDEMQQGWVVSGGSREIRRHSHFTEDSLEFPFAISDYKQEAGNCIHSQLQWMVHKTFFSLSDTIWLLSTLRGMAFVPCVDFHTICSPEGLPMHIRDTH